MPQLGPYLELERCPHCRVDKPTLMTLIPTTIKTTTHTGTRPRLWRVYQCKRCGGVVTAASEGTPDGPVTELYPYITAVDEAIPQPARSYLNQAINSLHAPSGSVMLSASAVDAMLKAKSYKDGTFYSRINKAAEDHLITPEMAQWAHEIRLDANDQRHADESMPLPTLDDAQKCVDFALALGMFLFILPSRVTRGLAEATQKDKAA